MGSQPRFTEKISMNTRPSQKMGMLHAGQGPQHAQVVESIYCLWPR